MIKAIITSRANPRVQELSALRQRKFRQEQSLTLAEGVHLVSAALSADAPVATLIIAERAAKLADVHAFENLAHARKLEILRLSDSCYDKISQLDSPEGVAVTLRTAEERLEELLINGARLLVAAGVQDPGNAGALVRTAEAAGATGCVFLGGVDLSHPRFIRGAQGSTFRLPCTGAEESEFLATLAKTSIRLLVAEARESKDYREVDYKPPVALVVGSEGQGIPEPLLNAATTRISIPMSAGVESLNVAVAAGILLYQARLQWA